MQPSSELLSVRRPLVMSDHQSLRTHIPEINHAMPDLQIKWQRLGEAGLTIIKREKYEKVTQYPGSRLAKTNPETLAATLNNTVFPKMPTEGDHMCVGVTGVDFIGEGPLLSVAFLLESDQLSAEALRITNLLNKMNGWNRYWGNFLPHVSVATIDAPNAEQRVLDAFTAIAPESLRLQPVVAETS